MKPIGLLDIKQALWDPRFRDLFPEMKKEIDEFINNPSCACNRPLYKKLLIYKDRLKRYFPDREIRSIKQEEEKLSKNTWTVVNCHVDELEKILKNRFPKNKMMIEAVRWQDQVTVIVNEVGIL